MSTSVESLDRNALYELVWKHPVSKLAQQYGMSDVGFAKMCKGMGIPLPSRGHWARAQAGQPVRRPPLPKAKSQQLLSVRLRRLDDKAQEAFAESKRRTAAARKEASSTEFPSDLTDPHPLIRAAQARLKRKSGWEHYKGLRSAPAEVLHIEVTELAIDRAVLIFDALIKELEKRAGQVRVDPEGKRTHLTIDGTELELVLSEHVGRTRHEITPEEKRARDRYWDRSHRGLVTDYPSIPDYDYHPSGQLTLTVGRWPARSWRDTARTSLEQRLPEVISGILTLALATREREEEEQRQRLARRARQERYDAQMKERADERQAFAKLKKDARNWVLASQLRAYVASVEANAPAADVQIGDLIAWAKWARQKADWVDPLVAISDVVLDAPEPEKPSYW